MRGALCQESAPDDGAWLEFSIVAPRPLLAKEALPPPGFRAELWRADVAELFLLNPETGVYLELHLNPRAAWWIGRFSAPRMLDETEAFEALPVAASARIMEAGWTGSLRAPWRPLAAALGFPESGPVRLRANLTAIVWEPGGRRFFSAAGLRGERPDFHQPDAWPAVALSPDGAAEGSDF